MTRRRPPTLNIRRPRGKIQPKIPNEHTTRVHVLTRACASTGGILDHVGPGQLALPTPCSTWPVHDLINHIVGATRYFADLAEWGSLCDEVRKDGTAPFAAAIEVPGDAPAADQLAGFLGRAPSWFGAQ